METNVHTGRMTHEDEGRDEVTALNEARNAEDCLQSPGSRGLAGEAWSSMKKYAWLGSGEWSAG